MRDTPCMFAECWINVFPTVDLGFRVVRSAKPTNYSSSCFLVSKNVIVNVSILILFVIFHLCLTAISEGYQEEAKINVCIQSPFFTQSAFLNQRKGKINLGYQLFKGKDLVFLEKKIWSKYQKRQKDIQIILKEGKIDSHPMKDVNVWFRKNFLWFSYITMM